MNMKLSNKVALVTGGTSGIGLETAKLFRNEGAHVIVVGAEQAGVNTASCELGSNVVALCADLRTPGELDKVFDESDEGLAVATSCSPMPELALPRRWRT
jgi:NAD(P)-dependent dehydrogenase (short-subunit alcohol dehydrogenase family)